MSLPPNILLAGDIGGTKTTLALFRASQHLEDPLKQQTFRNAGVDRLETLIKSFLEKGKYTPDSACFGVAGPVLANQVRMTNLNWSISGKNIGQAFSLQRVDIINDLVATAIGALRLPDRDIQPLHVGCPVQHSTLALLAPGTGLGEAFLFHDRQGQILPGPSEGGHAAFAPRNRQQVMLLEYMQTRHSHVSVEDVCSGRALPALFAFLQTSYPVPDWLQEKLASASDLTPLLIEAALADKNGRQKCDIAVHTLNLFIDILAGETANLALKTLAVGGIYIGGGIAPRILPFMDEKRFMAIFTQGIYHDLLDRIPVRIILNPQAALIGAAVYGATVIQDQQL